MELQKFDLEQLWKLYSRFVWKTQHTVNESGKGRAEHFLCWIEDQMEQGNIKDSEYIHGMSFTKRV